MKGDKQSVQKYSETATAEIKLKDGLCGPKMHQL